MLTTLSAYEIACLQADSGFEDAAYRVRVSELLRLNRPLVQQIISAAEETYQDPAQRDSFLAGAALLASAVMRHEETVILERMTGVILSQ